MNRRSSILDQSSIWFPMMVLEFAQIVICVIFDAPDFFKFYMALGLVWFALMIIVALTKEVFFE